MSSHQTRRREINGHIKQVRRLSERIQSTENGNVLKRQIEESSSTAHRTVVVTRVVGTKVVTGTPPPSSTSAAARTSEVRSSSPSVASTPTESSTPSVTPATTSLLSSSTTEALPSSTAPPSSTFVQVTRSPDSSYSTSTSNSRSSTSVRPVSLPVPTATSQSPTTIPLSTNSSKVQTSESASLSSGLSDSVNGTRIDQAAAVDGLSTGGKAGIAVGVIAAVAALLGLLFLIWKRKGRRSRRPYSFAQGYDREKERRRYRDSSVPINDKSGRADERDFGNVDNTDPHGYPPGGWTEKENRPETQFGDIANFAGIGRSNFVVAEAYEENLASNARNSGKPSTRNLTNIGSFSRYMEETPQQPSSAFAGEDYNEHYVYHDEQSSHGHGCSEDGRQTPTDQYGQAMSPFNVANAEQYADFPAHLDHAANNSAGKVPVQSGWQAAQATALASAGGLKIQNNVGLATTRSLSPIELIGGNENMAYGHPHRVQLNDGPNGTTMPQLPPLTLDSFDSPLYSGFATSSQRNSIQSVALDSEVNLHRKSSSAQPTALMYSSKKTEEELRKGYADLAKAAEIDDPQPLPIIGRNPNDNMQQLAPPIAPERYQHGRPLSPLLEVETPEASSLALAEEYNPFGSAGSRSSGFRAALTGNSPLSQLQTVSVPESPASYATVGLTTPRTGAGISGTSNVFTPDSGFEIQPPGHSFATQGSEFPETPQRHPFVGDSIGNSPTSVSASSRGGSLVAPPPIGNRLSNASSFSAAYDGI